MIENALTSQGHHDTSGTNPGDQLGDKVGDQRPA